MIHTFDSCATCRRQGAVSKEVALLLTELSKLWCSPELSAEDAQTRANNLRSKLGLVGQFGMNPAATLPLSTKSQVIPLPPTNVHVHRITGRMPPVSSHDPF